MRPRMVLVVVSLVASLALPATAAAAFATRTLAEGAKGRDVAKAQRLLDRALQEPIAADGAFGPLTAAAVRRFETANALAVDGALTPGEQRTLRATARRVTAERRAAADAAATGGVDPDAPPVQPAAPTTATAPAPAPTPPATATLNPDGTATAPPGAPAAVVAIIAAANEIATKPYRFGGGHRSWVDRGYDCSGSVSYALHGAGLLAAPLPSWSFETWGAPGPGTWVTIYAHKTHMYMTVAGLRFDTSGARPSRWQAAPRGADGFAVRHPDGL